MEDVTATVYLEAIISFAAKVRIPADTPEEDREQAAYDAAYDALGEICASCGGWGRNWSKDEGEYEPIRNEPVVWS